MQSRVIVEPIEEPITLEEAKNYLKIDVLQTEDDQLILRLIKAVRKTFEKYAQISFCTQTIEAYINSSLWNQLPYGPHQSIISVGFLGLNNEVEYEVTPESYSVSGLDYWSIYCNYYYFSTSSYTRNRRYKVEYVAGFGTASQVPEDIKLAILKEVAELYENRENTLVGSIVADLSTTSKTLLFPYKKNVLI